MKYYSKPMLFNLLFLLLFQFNIKSQKNPYLHFDEFKLTHELVYNKNASMEDDIYNSHNYNQRIVNLKYFLQNDKFIKDSLLLRMEFQLRPEEFSINDDMYYKADSSIIKMHARNIEYLYGTQTISSSSSNTSTETVMVATPATTETVTDANGNKTEVTIPSKNYSENVTVPTTHTKIETTPFRMVSIYIKLNQDDINLILKASEFKFRIYTNRGGSTINFKRYELNSLKKFIEGNRG
ncbi:MAG: hypothetical protein IPK91_09885 [Saprospiraceae bacterium]|nr:hypothetical protein [Saprospiraceae bacterium]MBK8297567.1 hypothetical protein [Saprospiraceae bacterium]